MFSDVNNFLLSFNGRKNLLGCIMYQAMQKVIEYDFSQIQLHSMEANIILANLASKKLLEKAGFVREAYFKQNYIFNGQFIDSEIYSLLNTKG